MINEYISYQGNWQELTPFQRKIKKNYSNEKLSDIINAYNNSLETQSIDKEKALWNLLYHKFKLKKKWIKIRE